MTQRDLALVEVLGGDRHFGQIVSAMTAEWLSAVPAAIEATAGTIAALPPLVFRVTENGQEEDPAHPLARIIRDGPNDFQTWHDFMLWLVAECLRFGNAIAELERDQAGRLTGLRPIPSDRRTLMLLPSGRIACDYTDPVTLRRRRLLDGEYLHLRDRSDDGMIGRARHERASPIIAAALALERHSGSLFEHGSWPNAAVELTGSIDQGGIDRLKAQIKSMFSGPEKSGKTLILPGGKWSPISASPVDQQLLEARRYAVEEVARLYQVPPMIIGDLSHGSFTNSETLIRFFAQSTISTWCRKIEAEFARSCLSAAGRRTHRLELDLSGLLRGDPETRWKSHEIALRNGVLSPNEVRQLEGWNPRDGGDSFDAPAGGAA